MDMLFSKDDFKAQLDQRDVKCEHHFIRDISFENPHAPFKVLHHERGQIAMNTNTKKTVIKNLDGKLLHNVCLTVTVNIRQDDEIFALIEIAQSGIFSTAAGTDPYWYDALMHVKATEDLFTRIVERIEWLTENGGLPKLTIQGPDFIDGFMRTPMFKSLCEHALGIEQQKALLA